MFFTSHYKKYFNICDAYNKIYGITYFINNIKNPKKSYQQMFTKNIAQRMYLFSKIYSCPKEATKDIKDNSMLLVGGFGISGVPMNLINALK